jgi:hypothetical protein
MSDWSDVLSNFRSRVTDFAVEANTLFSGQETSKARVISLGQTRRRLSGFSSQQGEMLDQAVQCCEFGVYRAAHVMAWSAFVDLLEQKLGSDGLVKVHAAKPNWAKFQSVDELRENVPEHQLIEVGRELGLYGKTEMKSLQGLLAKRNECAHPSGYRPGLNESLGYLSEVVTRMERLSVKSF